MRCALFAVALLPRIAAAQDEAAPDFEDLELLPIPEMRWELLVHENRDLFEQLEELGGRLEEIRDRMADDPESAWLRARRQSVGKRRAELAARLRKLLAKEGVDAGDWARVRRVPKGPLRTERYAHALVLEVANGKRRALLERVVVAVDAAELVTHRQRHQLERQVRTSGLDEVRTERLLDIGAEAFEQMEHRFWRTVDYVLTAEQKRALRRRLPIHYHNWIDPLEQMLFVPGLTPSQSGRLRALHAEMESTGGPEEALIRRLARTAEDESAADAEREKAFRAIHEAELRLVRAHTATMARAIKVLEPAQYDALLAVPPRVSIDALEAGPEQVLKGMRLAPAQLEKLAKFGERLEKIEHEHGRAMETLERKGRGELGPESPQMQGMEMMAASLEGAAFAKRRALLGEVFLDVLTPEQVVAWVLRSRRDD